MHPLTHMSSNMAGIFQIFYPPMSDDVTYNGYIGVHQLPAVFDLQVTSCYHSYALLDHSYVHQKPFLRQLLPHRGILDEIEFF